jgi:site-specific recombinase XerD
MSLDSPSCSTCSDIAQRTLDDRGRLFPGGIHKRPHLPTRQYTRIVSQRVASTGLDSHKCDTHTLRASKAAQVCEETGILRAAQLLPGHTKPESTMRYPGVGIEDALQITEHMEL